MAEIKGMWLQQPDSVHPDVVATEWRCDICGWSYGPIKSTWPQASLTAFCQCGTKVEIILPPTPNDGGGA